MKALILASNSPRRKELLILTGCQFSTYPVDINEDQILREEPDVYVRRLACQKAKVCASQQEGLIIGADTVVADQGLLLGKPKNEEEAYQMLKQLRGRTHQVYTGLALVDSDTGRLYDMLCRTDVPMRNYTDAEIEAYVSSGDPLDKAGAYAIQHAGFHPVEDLHGCFASVMGFPLCHLMVAMKTFDLHLPSDLPFRCQVYLNYTCPVFRNILGIN